jgi:hypothetical protein
VAVDNRVSGRVGVILTILTTIVSIIIIVSFSWSVQQCGGGQADDDASRGVEHTA